MSEFGKRMDGPNGRRGAPRADVSLPASMFSLEHSRVVIIENISSSGARLTGSDLPQVEEDVWIRVGPIDAFGSVVWRSAVGCGITFDRPLGELEESYVHGEARLTSLTRLLPEQRAALDDWRTGTVR